jgi:hypothetical protein
MICVICFETVSKDLFFHWEGCQHPFHPDCLKPLFNQKETVPCPNCRATGHNPFGTQTAAQDTRKKFWSPIHGCLHVSTLYLYWKIETNHDLFCLFLLSICVPPSPLICPKTLICWLHVFFFYPLSNPSIPRKSLPCNRNYTYIIIFQQ